MADNNLPYDRPKLSKNLGAKIEVRRGARVTAIDAEKKTVTLDDEGGVLEFSKLLVCTCGVPRRLGVKGESLAGVYYLRTIPDANIIDRESAR